MEKSGKNFTGASSMDGKRFYSAVGTELRIRRIECGYTNAELFTAQHGINRTTYYRMEKGKGFQGYTLAVAVEALKISLSDFFARVEKRLGE